MPPVDCLLMFGPPGWRLRGNDSARRTRLTCPTRRELYLSVPRGRSFARRGPTCCRPHHRAESATTDYREWRLLLPPESSLLRSTDGTPPRSPATSPTPPAPRL